MINRLAAISAAPSQAGLVAPYQVDQVPERHLQRPRNSRPEAQCRKEGRGKAEVFLDEEGSDDSGQSGHPCRDIDHQWWQVGKPHLAAQFEDIVVKPAMDGSEHNGTPANLKLGTVPPSQGQQF
jgi:hypothetical protein